ncbi:MAG TPA: DUF445 domain-containing protein, partial [Niabella sp.]
NKESNVALLVTEVSRLLKQMIEKADEEMVIGFITKKSEALLKDIKLNEIAANGLILVIDRGDHARLLNFLVNKIKNYVISNEELVKQKVKQESHFLIPGFVNNYIASKLTAGIAKYLDEIGKDPNHKIRNDIHTQLLNFADSLKTNPQWEKELQELKDELLSEEKLKAYATSIWKAAQKSILQDLSSGRSALQHYFRKSVKDLGDSLQQDAALRDRIDGWIRRDAYFYILRNTEQAGRLISNTVGNWEGKELSNKLELEVGKDLQFIRINGTLVGGLVGLLIYTLSRLL